MCAVISGGDLVSPVVLTGSDVEGSVHCVSVLALTVEKLSKLTRLVDVLHLHTSLGEGVVLCYHIDLAGLLNCAAKCNALADSTHSGTLGKHVLTSLERLDSELCVLVEVVCENNCVDVSLREHFVVICEELDRIVLVKSVLDDGQLVGVEIANCGQLHTGIFRGRHKYLSSACTYNGILNNFHNCNSFLW